MGFGSDAVCDTVCVCVCGNMSQTPSVHFVRGGLILMSQHRVLVLCDESVEPVVDVCVGHCVHNTAVVVDTESQ